MSQRSFVDLPTFRFFPYSCRYCVYWESTEDSDEKVEPAKAEEIKRNWLDEVSRNFGNCAFIAYKDNVSVGYAQYGPPQFFPRIEQYSSGPPSKDSAFLACLYVPKREMRRKGIGKYLLELVLSNLEKKGCVAVETFARRGSENNPAGPLEFYLHNGFKIIKEKDDFPLVRRSI